MDKFLTGKKLSAIIRLKNDERWIGFTIQSILDFFPEAEIVIIDNTPTDEALQICRLFNKPKMFTEKTNSYSKIIFKKIKNYTPGKALNMGVKIASRENIMIISSHCVIKKINYLKLEKDLEIYAGIFGNQIPIYLGKKIQKRYVWSNFINKRSINLFSKIENRFFFHNAFSFFKKKIIVQNLFNEDLTGKEDRYWAKKIVEKKLKYVYEPEHQVEHYYTTDGNTWKGLA